MRFGPRKLSAPNIRVLDAAKCARWAAIRPKRTIVQSNVTWGIFKKWRARTLKADADAGFVSGKGFRWVFNFAGNKFKAFGLRFRGPDLVVARKLRGPNPNRSGIDVLESFGGFSDIDVPEFLRVAKTSWSRPGSFNRFRENSKMKKKKPNNLKSLFLPSKFF